MRERLDRCSNLDNYIHGDFREPPRGSAALTGITRESGAISGVVQEKVA